MLVKKAELSKAWAMPIFMKAWEGTRSKDDREEKGYLDVTAH
jgi:hypothetical protein